MKEKTEEIHVEAFLTGEVLYLDSTKSKDTLCFVGIETGLLMKDKDLEWIKEELKHKGTLKLSLRTELD